ncbi:MAG: FtsX-like permease family protein [Alphaproteobacteria bacterium]|nr:FtsX-like permease family protein [Alphaproteobacteria bacterium]
MSATSFEPLGLAFRFARREMRGGLRGFRIFLACLAMGVAAIAAVGSVSSAIVQGLKEDGKVLLGADVDLRLTHIRADDEKLTWLQANAARVGELALMRAMAVRADGEGRRLVELKAVDDTYPMHGAVELAQQETPGADLDSVLAPRGDAFGAAVSSRLLTRLDLDLGDRFKIGEADFIVAAELLSTPDRGNQGFELGPPVVISMPALEATDLLQPGSLIRFHYRIDLPADQDLGAWLETLQETFPNAGWRVRALDNAAPGIQRFVDRVTLFLTLTGLTALLVGGVGVGNAVRAFLDARTGTIATLKCLGASSGLIFATYLIQVLALAFVGIAIGLVIGGLAPVLAAPILVEKLPIAARVGFYWEPMIVATVFGVLVTLIFALWPLAKAQTVPAASLFRNLLTPITKRPSTRMMAVIAGAGLLLAAVAILTSERWDMAAGFVGGSVAALAAFRLAALGVIRLARAAPRPKNAKLRLALANLHRPGAPTASVVVSLGLGLTVLATVALIEGNLSNQLNKTLRGEAPGFFFIDIQPDQIEEFDARISAFPTVTQVDRVPMMRGAIAAMNGVRAEEIDAPPDFSWILRGDRGITWSREPPANSDIVRGDWWPADYSGELLVSFDVEAADAFGLEIGDTLTVNLLGRELEAKIANMRKIDWSSFGINFIMVFSPGVMESAPQSFLATAFLDPEREADLEAEITRAFPNVSSVRMKEVLESVNTIVANLATAVRAIAAVAIVAGVLVLTGAIAAGHARRVYDAVVLKVLGATRRDVASAFLIEYGLMGLVTALIAIAVGTVAAWSVMTLVMRAEWVFIPVAAGSTVLVSVLATIAVGMTGVWLALGRKAAPLLRNE